MTHRSFATKRLATGDRAFDNHFVVQAGDPQILTESLRADLVALDPQARDPHYDQGHARLQLLGTDQSAADPGQALAIVCALCGKSST